MYKKYYTVSEFDDLMSSRYDYDYPRSYSYFASILCRYIEDLNMGNWIVIDTDKDIGDFNLCYSYTIMISKDNITKVFRVHYDEDEHGEPLKLCSEVIDINNNDEDIL